MCLGKISAQQTDIFFLIAFNNILQLLELQQNIINDKECIWNLYSLSYIWIFILNLLDTCCLPHPSAIYHA